MTCTAHQRFDARLPTHPLNQATQLNTLAIVIPAFKAEFLDRALASLHDNDLERCRIYIADDGSPQPIAPIVDRWRQRLPLHYQRFDENLGSSSLVAHWNRSVRLSHEPWVWLPGDDDEFESGCVQAVLSRIDADARGDAAPDLYRFNVVQIDANSAITQVLPTYPPVLSASAFVRHRLAGTLSSFAPEYVFRRAAWDAIGGFVDFPLAWCSDDATWALLGGAGGIQTVIGPRVRWRYSGLNISSHSAVHAVRKAEAATLFIGWLRTQWPRIDADKGFEAAEMKDLAANWLFDQVNVDAPARIQRQAVLVSWRSARGWRTAWSMNMARRVYWAWRAKR